MAISRKNSSDRDDNASSGDGSSTLRLREAETGATISRRGLLWRAGLATAAGVAGLTALDQHRADAATGGNWILGQSNNASSTTTLTPTADLKPMLHIDGSAMGTTDTAMVVDGPTGGHALNVHAGAGPSGTVGLALAVSADGGSSAISASSGSGVGVAGNSTSGTGVSASSASGTALSVTGKAKFSRSGTASVGQGSKTKTVSVSGMKSTSLVLATLQTSITGVYITAAVPGSGKFTVHLNKNTPAAAKFAWFVLN